MTPNRVALYARVSSDEQARRETVQPQLDSLRKIADALGWHVVGEYVDEGYSGTLALGARPDGRRLLADAAAGHFDTVAVFRIDRFARSIRVLLDAHDTLEGQGVALRSASEPFDTSNPMGKFMLTMLGGMAELERSTIAERLTLGRDRHARNGRWLGVLPLGYDVDADGALVPSTRLVAGLDMTEAELVTDLYGRLAAGSTLRAECKRWNALGLKPVRRYANGTVARETKRPDGSTKWRPPQAWTPPTLGDVVRNPIYTGRHTFDSDYGPIERAVPALASVPLWEQAQRQLTSNRKLSKVGTARDYLLRGLVACENCGSSYTGGAVVKRRRDGTVYEWRGYRCNGNKRLAADAAPCRAKIVNADEIEHAIWQHCREFIYHPGPALQEAQAQLRARKGQAADHSAERARLVKALAAKEAERERVMTLFRRNLITLDEAETQLAAVAREQADARALLAALDNADAVTQAAESQLAAAATSIKSLRARLQEVEATGDWAKKRGIVEALVREVRIETTGDGHGKRAGITARYAFGPAVAAEADTGSATRRRISRRPTRRATSSPTTSWRSGWGSRRRSTRRSRGPTGWRCR